MDASIWLHGGLDLVGGAFGAWVGIKVALSRLEERVRVLEAEMGTHDTGLRGAVHRMTNAVIKLSARIPNGN